MIYVIRSFDQLFMDVVTIVKTLLPQKNK